METVKHELIDESTEELHNLGEGALKDMVYQMSEEQPDLMSYLLTVGEQELSAEDQEVLLFLGLNVWNAFKKYQTLPFVPDKKIHKKNEENEALIDKLEHNKEQGFTQLARSIIDDHSQEPLLEYIVQAIVEEDMEEEEPLVSEENRDLLFLTLKTFVESIGSADQGQPA